MSFNENEGYFPNVGDVPGVTIGHIVRHDLLPAVGQKHSVLAVGVVAGPELGIRH